MENKFLTATEAKMSSLANKEKRLKEAFEEYKEYINSRIQSSCEIGRFQVEISINYEDTNLSSRETFLVLLIELKKFFSELDYQVCAIDRKEPSPYSTGRGVWKFYGLQVGWYGDEVPKFLNGIRKSKEFFV